MNERKLASLKELGLNIPPHIVIIGPCGCGGLAWGRKHKSGKVTPLKTEDGEELPLCSDCWIKLEGSKEKVKIYKAERAFRDYDRQKREERENKYNRGKF